MARRMEIIRQVQDWRTVYGHHGSEPTPETEPQEQVGCSSPPNSVPPCRSGIKGQAAVHNETSPQQC